MSEGTNARKRPWWILGLLVVAAVVLITIFVLPSGNGPSDGSRDDPGRAEVPASRPTSEPDDAA